MRWRARVVRDWTMRSRTTSFSRTRFLYILTVEWCTHGHWPVYRLAGGPALPCRDAVVVRFPTCLGAVQTFAKCEIGTSFSGKHFLFRRQYSLMLSTL